MRLRTRGVLAALPLAFALTLAGCGGDGEEPGVASAGGETAAGAAPVPGRAASARRRWA
ncbi:hypothetical protein [Actinomadura sp. CNU-125]|uniref:hypothetical protein n=1 Tax=Actinomadura sp. CNU-125 TaxID=1904961 RepID=UPI0021CC55A1|nr:hypothetical protein [Actinomadura sp. CNU-125]